MGLMDHYINKYLDKVKDRWGRVYLEAHIDGRCIIKSEDDHRIIFTCSSFNELIDELG